MYTKSRSRGFTLTELLVVIVIVGIAIAALFIAFGQGLLVSDNRALRAAEAHGFTEARVTDRHVLFVASWHGCGEGDEAAFEIAATNPAGQPAELLVCCGWPLKGCTLRTE